MKYLAVLLMGMLTACAAHALDSPTSAGLMLGIKVESAATLDASDFDAVIAKAAANGDAWPASPALVAYQILGGDAEARSFRLSCEANRAESPDQVVCVVVRDGFLDDAVQGDWHQLHLSKAPDQRWRIVKVLKASRCWRNDAKIYQSAQCP